jgi:cobalt-zinc-cadmium efflux system protein
VTRAQRTLEPVGHGHAHGDGGGHGHSHEISADADRRKLAIALGLILAFMVVEVAVGIAASSLALLSDAAHMLTDAAAIALALVAINLARRPAHGAYTFGLRRAEILSAQFNGATLLVLGLLVVVEGVRRIVNPPDVAGGAVLVVALIGIVVNLVATMTLARANRQSLNVEGAYQHLLTDLAAFIATAIAGAIILLTGFGEADGIAALIVAVIMLYASFGLFREEIGRALVRAEGIVEVHDLHVWEVSSGFPSLAAHVVVGRDRDCHQARLELQTLLRERFGIEHTTLQMDHEGGDLVQLEVRCEEGLAPISAPAAPAAGPPAARPR